MKLSAILQHRLHWLNLPGALLIALLQRLPIGPMAATAEQFVSSSPISTVLKSATAFASLGALHSLAGATTLVTNNHDSPLNVTVGTVIPQVIFSVAGDNVSSVGSWEVANDSAIPPGLAFAGLTAPGTVNIANPALVGTPTTPGTYLLTLQAFLGPNRTLDASPTFTYSIIITNAILGAPAITAQPQSQTVAAGATVTFVATASGTPTPTFQWRKNSTNIAGATNSSLVLTNVTAADAGTYTVVATNSIGSATSNGAVLTVGSTGGATAPAITTQPQSVTVNSGGTVALAVIATSASSPPIYQWRKDGSNLTGATSDTLILKNVTSIQSGLYSVVVTNAIGATTSTAATLAVTTGQISRISNISVRTFLGSGQTLVMGFVTSTAKNLMIRAVGPSLNPGFGLTQFYADPRLSVIRQGVMIDQNDNWNASLAPTFVTLGAFPLTAGSKDAALVRSVIGPNTAHINGPSAGIILVEVYDADPASASSRLTNVSARDPVGTGNNILISGFVIDGTAARTLLVRGIGPGLHDIFGVVGELADPVLEVHQTVNGQEMVVASNDNWNTNLVPVFTQLGAYQL